MWGGGCFGIAATASGSAVEARAAPAHMMNTIALEASQVFSSAPPIALSSSQMLGDDSSCSLREVD